MAVKVKKKKEPPRFYDIERDGVTKTLLNKYLECERAAGYFLQGWDSQNFPIHMVWGIIFHDVKAEVYTEKVLKKKKITDKYVMKLVKKYSKPHFDPTWTADQCQDFEIMRGQIMAVVKPYFKRWRKHDSKIEYLPFEEKFKVEVPFLGKKMVMQGRWDGIFKRRKETWIQETKTKSQISANLITTIHRDLQVNMYMLAAEILTGEKVSGVVYDLVRRPGLRKKKGSKNVPAESLRDFIKRIRVDVAKRPDHYFQRFEVVVDPKEFKEWKEKELPLLLVRFMKWLKAGRGGPKIGMACTNRYGGLCQYFPICAHGKTDGFKKREVVFPELEDD